MVPQSGGLKQAAMEAGERMGRRIADNLVPKLDRLMTEAAERFGIDPASLGAPLSARLAAAEAEEHDEEAAYAAPAQAPLRRAKGDGRSVDQLLAARTAPAAATHPAEGSAAAEPDEVALPEGWSSAVSPDGRTYFYHAATRTTQWKPPVAEAAEAAALPPGWRRVQDARGRWYYFHKETRTTQWGPP